MDKVVQGDLITLDGEDYLILDTLIPVCKSNKWGAYNKQGQVILPLEYDDFGYGLNNIEIDGIKKVVQPLLQIERCNGIVVKKENKYGLMDLNGKELVPIAVESIYSIVDAQSEDSRYFMLYNGRELNVIERLIKAGLLIEENNKEEENIDNTTITNKLDNSTSTVNNTNLVNNNESSFENNNWKRK